MNELIMNSSFEIDYIVIYELKRREKLKRKRGKKILPQRGFRKIKVSFEKEDFNKWTIKDIK